MADNVTERCNSCFSQSICLLHAAFSGERMNRSIANGWVCDCYVSKPPAVTKVAIPGWPTLAQEMREKRDVVKRFAKKLAEDSRVDPETLRQPMTI